MLDLTPLQMRVLERLFAAGFRPIAIPPYENVLCVHRGECAAPLVPVKNGGLRMMAPATYLVEGSLGVRIKRDEREVFVWKKKELEATTERLQELEAFGGELAEILKEGAAQ
jgi:hypothetical protein